MYTVRVNLFIIFVFLVSSTNIFPAMAPSAVDRLKSAVYENNRQLFNQEIKKLQKERSPERLAEFLKITKGREGETITDYIDSVKNSMPPEQIFYFTMFLNQLGVQPDIPERLGLSKMLKIKKRNSRYDQATLNRKFLGFVQKGEVEKVIKLLDMGAQINVRSENRGVTALMVAAASGHKRVVSNLLMRQADVLALDNQGRSALMRAVFIGRTDIVNLLIRNGASINQKSHDGHNALMRAVLNKDEGMLDLLLKNNAHVDERNREGVTALMLAAYKENLPMVRKLLSVGADQKLVDNNGHTIMWWAQNRERKS